MSDYLMRDGAPFGSDVWAKIDGMVADVVKKNLVGRRFIELIGPLGWGVEVAPTFGFESAEGADAAASGGYLPLEELRAEFLLKAKHLAVASATPFALDLGAVAMAATKLAKAEDELLLGGLVKGALAGELGAWDSEGAPFKAIAAAIAKLRGAGFDGPYAALMSPGMYATMAAQMRHGRREIEMVERLVQAGLYQTTSVSDGQVLVTSPQPWNYDLVVGQDIATAYLGNQGLDHRFRIFETLVLRVKRPHAVCVLK
ncbi:MAG: encapsulin [Anaerolineae bacterium]|nr:encapsulin [Anaerolineae bacterium]